MKQVLSLSYVMCSILLCSASLATDFDFETGNQGWRTASLYDGESLYPLGVCREPFLSDGQACRFNRDCDVDAREIPGADPGVCDLASGFFAEEPARLFTASPGTIIVGTGGATMPLSPTGSGFVHWDFMSPDLESDPMWQGIEAFSFSISGSAMASAGGKAYVEAVIHVRKPDGNEAYFTDGALHEIRINRSDFEPVFTTHIAYLDRARVPLGSTVLDVSLRVMVEADTGYDGYILLDQVTPNPALDDLPAAVTVDQSDIRGPGQFKGPLSEIIVALARTAPDGTQDVLPPGPDGNQDPPGEGAAFVQALFDTGSETVAFLPGHFDCTASSKETFCLSPDTLPQQLEVRVNGMSAIDPVTLRAPLGPPVFDLTEAAVPSILVGLSTKDRNLIGAPVATRVRAIIDNRKQSRVMRGEGEFTNIVFNPPSDSILERELGAKLRLQRFGEKGFSSKGATQDQRFYLRNLSFHDNGAEVSDNEMVGLDKGLRFFWDSATTFTMVSRRMAASLGILGQPSDFICNIRDRGEEFSFDGYVLDAIRMYGTNQVKSHYTVQNPRVCVEDDDPATRAVIQAGDGLIGSNLFEQVRLLFDGPIDSMHVLTDPADLNSNFCIDQADYQSSSESFASLHRWSTSAAMPRSALFRLGLARAN